MIDPQVRAREIDEQIRKLQVEKAALDGIETCGNCGKVEEGDIFGGIIEGKYWCPECCEPLKAKWYAEQKAKNE